jgi:hypothetical protein
MKDAVSVPRLVSSTFSAIDRIAEAANGIPVASVRQIFGHVLATRATAMVKTLLLIAVRDGVSL